MKYKWAKEVRLIIPITLLVLLGSSTLLVAMERLKWGGPGYDPSLKNSSRFSAQPCIYSVKRRLSIWVDSKETVKEVGQIQLISSGRQDVSSIKCWKALGYKTAPWACSFNIENVKQLSGEGVIRVKNISGEVLLEDDVDLKKLSSMCGKFII